MRDALGRLNAELYPPFKETGFDVRSQAPMPLPPLIDSPRRGGEKATLATTASSGNKPATGIEDTAPSGKPGASSPPPGGKASNGGTLVPDDEASPSATPKKPSKPAAKPAPKKKGAK
jgi:hypothetical protein